VFQHKPVENGIPCWGTFLEQKLDEPEGGYQEGVTRETSIDANNPGKIFCNRAKLKRGRTLGGVRRS